MRVDVAPGELRVADVGRHQLRNDDQAARRQVAQPCREIDVLADVIARIDGIGLRVPDMQGDLDLERPSRRADRVILMALLHAHGPLRGLHRIVEDEQEAVAGILDLPAAGLLQPGRQSVAVRRLDRLDVASIPRSPVVAGHQ